MKMKNDFTEQLSQLSEVPGPSKSGFKSCLVKGFSGNNWQKKMKKIRKIKNIHIQIKNQIFFYSLQILLVREGRLVVMEKETHLSSSWNSLWSEDQKVGGVEPSLISFGVFVWQCSSSDLYFVFPGRTPFCLHDLMQIWGR